MTWRKAKNREFRRLRRATSGRRKHGRRRGR